MKQYIVPTLIAVAAGMIASTGVFNKRIPGLSNNATPVTKEEQIKVITENIEEYKKVSHLENDVTKAIETASPSVVSIIATKDLDAYLTDPFGFFLGLPQQRAATPKAKTQKIKVGWGSGIIGSKDGYVITNKHVVADIEAEYTVVTQDGDTYKVKQVRTDPMLDIAILQIIDEKGNVPENLVPAKFVSLHSPVRIGQFVVAIGNALTEYANSATFGIISAKNRTLDSQLQQPQAAYLGLYQTDTPINPGNSGGPLLNIQWEIIGMNTAIATEGDGIGFAMPLTKEFVQTSLASLTESGSINRPYLGVQSISLSTSTAKRMNLTKFAGIILQSVDAGSPAAAAGLLSGDVITEINNETVLTDMPLLYSLYTRKATDTLNLLVYRNGEYKKIDVVLGGQAQ